MGSKEGAVELKGGLVGVVDLFSKLMVAFGIILMRVSLVGVVSETWGDAGRGVETMARVRSTPSSCTISKLGNWLCSFCSSIR